MKKCEVEKSGAVCHAVPLPAIPLSSSPPPSPLSPPCQEWHQSPPRASLQGRNSEKPANDFSVHTRTYAYRHIHVSYVSQWDHPRYMPPCSLLTQTQPPPTPTCSTRTVCVSSKQWVETTSSRSLQEREGATTVALMCCCNSVCGVSDHPACFQ